MQKIRVTPKLAGQLVAVTILFLFVLIISISEQVSIGQKFQKVYFNGTEIGCVNTGVDVKQSLQQMRRELASESEQNLCMDYELSVEISNQWFTNLLSEEELQEVLKEQLRASVITENTRSYTIAIEGYRGNFTSLDEALSFLNSVKDKADEKQQFTSRITKEKGHISGILTASLVENETENEAEVIPVSGLADGVSAGVNDTAMYQMAYSMKNNGNVAGVKPEETLSDSVTAGVNSAMMYQAMYQIVNPPKDEYETGILQMEFIEKVELFENYVAVEELSNVETEVAEVTKEKETNKIYVVESGDCLSVIAMNHDMTVAELMALNEFDNENVPICPGDELIVAVPKPDLGLRVTIGEVYEEDYEEDPIIIENDSWYTTKQVVHEEGTTGHRERNDAVTYENGIETAREMMHQTIMVEATPAVIEQGTITPPTYIKPLSGGRFTSGFGRRWGRLHKGVDFACPVGTTLYASSAGTVISAGYSKGYGYNVLISHPDGKMTRYAHCSKLLVQAGQYVEQGETIAKSGNTGNSTGPHVHFEIYVNGVPVNPMQYISY